MYIKNLLKMNFGYFSFILFLLLSTLKINAGVISNIVSAQRNAVNTLTGNSKYVSFK